MNQFKLMSDLFDNLTSFLNKDFLVATKEFIKNPNSNLTEQLSNQLNKLFDDQKINISELYDNLQKEKNNLQKSSVINKKKDNKYVDSFNEEYEELYFKLKNIEEHMNLLRNCFDKK
tara:strand:+ start:1712 stop:2062 length:351 start_codon:yes stop_codon:yes gene_type:complete